jgi:hypothetical protein
MRDIYRYMEPALIDERKAALGDMILAKTSSKWTPSKVCTLKHQMNWMPSYRPGLH